MALSELKSWAKKKVNLQPLILHSNGSPPNTLGSVEVVDGDLILGKHGLVTNGGRRSLLDSLRGELALDAEASVCLSPDEHDTTSRKGFTISLQDLEPVKAIGAGSSGVVQKVRHKPSGRFIVLKVIRCNLRSDNTRKQIFGELRTLRSCAHPKIVRYMESFYDNGTVTIAMEFMDRGSMADLFRAFGHVPEHFLAMMITQVLEGLEYLHSERRIVHRDVKPSNLLVSGVGEVKLSDFGVSGQLTHSIIDCSSWVGTMTYMSPERLKGGSYSYASDIWSVGLVLAEGALGRFPYAVKTGQAPDFWQLMEKITNDGPLPMKLTESSSELRDFVTCCLRKNASERWTAAQLLQHPFILKHSCHTSMRRLMDEFAAVIGPYMASPRA
ncbi:hypothetical protein WJX73_006001 [Symbiochloris irregularis]|uniref:mitogen-activated protein kinase kinase n=1 Tax=Symbiochloris irregularis TaxID=706552 RepID=A0AAW1NYT8_9CHLO